MERVAVTAVAVCAAILVVRSGMKSLEKLAKAMVLPASAVLEEILRGSNRYIPDEVLVQILSKLPAKSVLRCRCVCRRWKALISTPEFAKLHLNHSIPMIIVVQQLENEKKKLYFGDTFESTEETSTEETKKYRYSISVNSVMPVSKSDRREFVYSSNGLVIFREEFRKSTSGLEHYVLLNPIIHEKVRLITPRGLIYGIFSNPFAKDQYCLLWGGRFLGPNGRMQFRFIVLGGETKSLSQSQTCCWRELNEDADSPFSYQPRAQSPPLIVNDVLYWMVGNRYEVATEISPNATSTRSTPCCAESIMTLDTKREKFSVMPHPGPQDQYCKDDPEHNRMHLVEMDDHGFLCLCECSLFEESINIWILKQKDDDHIPLWMRWHRVNIDLDVSRFPFASGANDNIRPVVIADGELLLEWPNRGLFAFNLKMGTVRMFERRGGTFNRRGEYMFNVSMYAHTPNFVRLSNCEPEILMTT